MTKTKDGGVAANTPDVADDRRKFGQEDIAGRKQRENDHLRPSNTGNKKNIHGWRSSRREPVDNLSGQTSGLHTLCA